MKARMAIAVVLAAAVVAMPVAPVLAAARVGVAPEYWCASRWDFWKRLCEKLIGTPTAPGADDLFKGIRPVIPIPNYPRYIDEARRLLPVRESAPSSDVSNNELERQTWPPIPKPGTLGGHVVRKVVGDTVRYGDRYRSEIIVMPGQTQGKLIWAFKIGESRARDLNALLVDWLAKYRSSLRFECRDIGAELVIDPLAQDALADRFAALVGIRDPFDTNIPFSYSLNPDTVRRFAARGAIDQSAVDLSRIPWGSPTRNVGFARQPTIAEAMLSARPPENPEFVRALGWIGTLSAPGVLYMNFVFVAEPGDKKWAIQSWNYAFEVDFDLSREFAKLIYSIKDEWRVSFQRCTGYDPPRRPTTPQQVPGTPPDYPQIQTPNVPPPPGVIICRGRVIDPTKREDIYLCVDPKLIR